MPLDLNDAEEQRSFGVIPDGTFCKVVLTIRPGGASIPGCDPMDAGLFKASRSSDAIMLDTELTVASGSYAHKKFWENMTVAGGALDEKGNSKGFNMTKSRVRAMLESATGTDPKDMSEKAKAARRIAAFKQLDKIPFWVKLRVEAGEEYAANDGTTKMGYDKNLIDRIVIPGDEEYAALSQGQEVAAKPSGRASGPKATGGGNGAAASRGPTAGQPAWAQPASGAPAQPALPGTAPAQAAPPTPGPAWLTK